MLGGVTKAWDKLNPFLTNDGSGILVVDFDPGALVLTDRGFKAVNPLQRRVVAQPVYGLTPKIVFEAMVSAAQDAGHSHIVDSIPSGVPKFGFGIAHTEDLRLKHLCEGYSTSPWMLRNTFLLFTTDPAGRFSATEQGVAAVLSSTPWFITVTEPS